MPISQESLQALRATGAFEHAIIATFTLLLCYSGTSPAVEIFVHHLFAVGTRNYTPTFGLDFSLQILFNAVRRSILRT